MSEQKQWPIATSEWTEAGLLFGDTGGLPWGAVPFTEPKLPITQVGLPLEESGLPLRTAALPLGGSGLPFGTVALLSDDGS